MSFYIFYKLNDKRGMSINIRTEHYMMCLSNVLYVWFYKTFFQCRWETVKHHFYSFHTHYLKEMSEMHRPAFTTKSCSPAINDVAQQSSSCSLLSSPFLEASIVFLKGCLPLWQMRMATMSRCSVTRREAQAVGCLITDRQLPGHPAVAWTENVRYFEDGGRC